MKIACPSCSRMTNPGAFCERCGSPIDSAADEAPTRCEEVADEPEAPSARPGPADAAGSNPYGAADAAGAERRNFSQIFPRMSNADSPSLNTDALCVQFENLPGIVRFWFDPGYASAGVENVRICCENQLSRETVSSRLLRFVPNAREVTVQIPGQNAGVLAWTVTLEYECAGRRCTLEGEYHMVVIRPQEAQSIADNLAINITNSINNGHASDVNVSQQALDDLVKLSAAENPFVELRRIVSGRARSWEPVELYDSVGADLLPQVPECAKTERLTLDFGSSRITFLAGRTILFGRSRSDNDISLRPAPGSSEETLMPYRRVSRAHCHFEHQGEVAVVCDGQRDERHVLNASSYGTFWNGARLDKPLRLASGETGIVAFGASHNAGGLSMELKVCGASGDCRNCPHLSRHWCGDGSRPSLMLTRRDGIQERFVAVWSCFQLGDADPSFEGVTIFRRDGAFAWRKGRRCGWIIPGTSQKTDLGTVVVS